MEKVENIICIKNINKKLNNKKIGRDKREKEKRRNLS